MANWKGKKFEDFSILVVDDEDAIIKMAEALLRDMGVTSIYKATNGAQALDYFVGGIRVIDLIICDWMMPEMDGMKFIRRVRAMKVDAPVILLTSKKEPDDIVEAKEAGVTAYIAKPFTAVQFQEKVNRVAEAVMRKREKDK